ncbi:uncharacterized protein [Phyllobates terribilis]|uniref:uncharacterized protein n=1 Tax=Phyllobates terribilis TaxID=111132 RepID=UPI003CCB0CCB
MDSFLADGGASHAWHFAYAVYFAFFFVAARFLFDKFIFRRLAKWMLSKGSAEVKMDDVTRAKIGKCSESMWKLTYYATVEACILHFTFHEPWVMNTKEYFKGWPNQEVMLPVKLYYMCQCGFYLYSIAALLVWETRRKDFAVMMSHHVITVILIGYSYIARFSRIGSIVLALHDASDVFMEAAKVFKYSDYELAASVCFGFFAVSWLILRLIFFPFWVIKTSSYDFKFHLNLWESYPKSLYYIFNTMLLMLLVFHIYWWLLICAMIIKQLKNKGKVGEDIRSDSEDDE